MQWESSKKFIESEEMNNTMLLNSFIKKRKKIQLLLLSKFVTVCKNEIIRWGN